MIVLRTKQFGPGLGPGFGPVVKPTGRLGMNSNTRPKTLPPASKPVGGWGNPKNTPSQKPATAGAGMNGRNSISPRVQQMMEQQKDKLVASQQKLAQRPQPIQGGILGGSRPQAAGAPSQSTTIPFRPGM